MSYKYLTTINFFESQKVKFLLEKHDINPKIENSYHSNIVAGWIDPFCNSNERIFLVLEKDFVLAKKILEEKFK